VNEYVAMAWRVFEEVFWDCRRASPAGEGLSFFELGGDSLMAIQLLTRVAELYGVTLDVVRFFGDSTVAGLAAQLEEAGASLAGA
jgi:acyl carrier protein